MGISQISLGDVRSKITGFTYPMWTPGVANQGEMMEDLREIELMNKKQTELFTTSAFSLSRSTNSFFMEKKRVSALAV